jgi:hypothetical protein
VNETTRAGVSTSFPCCGPPGRPSIVAQVHRTTTTAALLVTVAVSALSGCVTVHGPATAGPPPDTAPALPTAPRADGSATPRVVQAPAREALRLVGPSRRPGHTPSAAAPRRPTAAPPPDRRAPSPAAPADTPPHPHSRHSRLEVPRLPHAVPGAPDVCALGRRYGGWRKDSPEAVICEQAYGH